jgi:hypothetical protein
VLTRRYDEQVIFSLALITAFSEKMVSQGMLFSVKKQNTFKG